MENASHELPRGLWDLVQPLFPPEKLRPKGGRPPRESFKILAGIFYRLRTRCQWKALPRHLPSGSVCHKAFQEWESSGLFRKVFTVAVDLYRR